ncbi:methyltransferase [Campylobacter rectus]|uniref:methyltransferase n=1 Tax=Campylobacter rectus TaxID=203 RepID=UPI0030B8E512
MCFYYNFTYCFGAPFLVLGAIYIALSNIQMKRIGKGNPADDFNAAIGERTKNLMTEGIYKHTRNPMLFSVFALYIGISLLTNSYAAPVFPRFLSLI